MKQDILINQSVAILVDGNNIERSIHEEAKIDNAMINFDGLIPKLLNGRGLNRLIYFREGRNISEKLAERLHNYYYGSVVPCHKTADIPLSIKATQLASKVDTIIIMSGDSDYIDLVRHLKGEGVRVEIAAVKKTTSRFLIEEADHFHEITKEDWFVYTKPGKRWEFKKPNAPHLVMPENVTPAVSSEPFIPNGAVVEKPQVAVSEEKKALVKKEGKKSPKKVGKSSS